jgi:GTP cyclohydrolase II
VLGSLRCDCGPQLRRAMQLIAENGSGVIIYLRQEGRGIGLPDKLRAYNLQDQGYDTVDANLMLGHQADGRDYTIAGLILRDQDVRSARLLTNNPDKIESLRRQGIPITARVPLTAGLTAENQSYLRTKVARMRHLLNLETIAPSANGAPSDFLAAITPKDGPNGRPFITLSYAQSLDGSIAARRGQPLALSGPESLVICHQLRARHDAILVGIGTVLADDPRLTVRLAPGQNPQPIVLDSHLRFPAQANLWQHPDRQLWLATTSDGHAARYGELEARGARLFCLPPEAQGRVDLPALVQTLSDLAVHSVMVEGGAQIISSFLAQQLADRVVVTIAPLLVGGYHALEGMMVGENGRSAARLRRPLYQSFGQDLVLVADLDW